MRIAKGTSIAGLITALTLVFASPAMAQTSTATEVGINFNVQSIYEEVAPGFNIDLSRIVSSVGTGLDLGVVGDFGVNKFDCCSQASFMGGLRLQTTETQVPLYFQFLLGAVSGFDVTDFAAMPGVGVKFNVNEALTARAQADVLMDFAEGKTWTGLRIGGGLVFAF